jgi:hypothetical protein
MGAPMLCLFFAMPEEAGGEDTGDGFEIAGDKQQAFGTWTRR